MKTALVIGTAQCLPYDLDDALMLFEPDFTVGVNVAAINYPVDHWASVHTELFEGWIKQRIEAFGDVPRLWTNDKNIQYLSRELVKMGFSGAPYWEGSSSALGVEVAQALGATRIVLAGIPLEDGLKIDGNSFTYAEMYQKEWLKQKPRLEEKIRSMSGWTARKFGYPTEEWLNGL